MLFARHPRNLTENLHCGRRLQMNLPSDNTTAFGHCAIVPPEALDEPSSWHSPPYEVLLSLMLLYFERKSRAENTLNMKNDENL